MAIKLTREGQNSKAQPWHRDYARCVICGSITRPHHSSGRCSDCARGRVVVAPPQRPARKRCKGPCGRELAAGQFHRDKHAPDGLYRLCKDCRRPVQAAVTARHAEQRRAYGQVYRAAHADEIKERARLRYHMDPRTPERQRRKSARFRARHLEEVRARKRADYAANAPIERQLARLRRAARKGAA